MVIQFQKLSKSSNNMRECDPARAALKNRRTIVTQQKIVLFKNRSYVFVAKMNCPLIQLMPFTYKGLRGLILNIVMEDNDSLFWIPPPLKCELMCLLCLPDHFSSCTAVRRTELRLPQLLEEMTNKYFQQTRRSEMRRDTRQRFQERKQEGHIMVLYKGWSVSSVVRSVRLFARELRGLWVCIFFFFFLFPLSFVSLSWTS